MITQELETPNFTNLEEALASLEEGKYATIFSSGLGAITALNFHFKKWR